MQARVRLGALIGLVGLVPAVAFGQSPPASPPADAPADAPIAAPAPPAAATPSDAPPPPPADNGYSYGKHGHGRGAKPAPPRGHVHRPAAPTGPIATYPGFEMTGDGGSRAFVQLSQVVQVEEKRGPGTITYILKGAKIIHRNNGNALITVDFNTPITRARLIPAGRDLKFVLDLRAPVAPTFRIDNAEDNAVTLNIDFPKGEYLGTPQPHAAKPPPPASNESGDSSDQQP